MKRWLFVAAVFVLALTSFWAVKSYSFAFLQNSASLVVTDRENSGSLISVTPAFQDKLTLKKGEPAGIFVITNNMGQAISYSLDSKDLDPDSGVLHPGEKQAVKLKIDEKSSPGATTFKTFLHAWWNGGSCRLTITVPFEITGKKQEKPDPGKKQPGAEKEVQQPEEEKSAVKLEEDSRESTGNTGLNTGNTMGNEGSGLIQEPPGEQAPPQDPGENIGSGPGEDVVEDPQVNGDNGNPEEDDNLNQDTSGAEEPVEG